MSGSRWTTSSTCRSCRTISARIPICFPPEAGYGDDFQFVPPEQIAALVDLMLDHGYPREAILKIIGGNHMRVAAAAWKSTHSSTPRSENDDDSHDP